MLRILFFIVILLTSHVLIAQIGGNGTYKFIDLPASARSAAMGGKMISLREQDLNLVADNPSILDSSMHNDLALSYINYLADINLGHVAYARNIRGFGPVSASMHYINYGTFKAADVTGQELGTFGAAEYALSLSHGRALDSLFSMGVSLQFIYSALEQYKSFGIATDFGGSYLSKNKGFSAGLVFRHMGAQLIRYTEKNTEPLPMEIQLGVSKRFAHAPLRLNFLASNLQKWDLTWIDPNSSGIKYDPITGDPINKLITFDKMMRHFVIGIEFLPSKNFNLRLAYNYQRRQELRVAVRGGMTGFSFGAEIKVSKFRISYGRATYHLAGASNHITLTTNISQLASKRQRPATSEEAN